MGAAFCKYERRAVGKTGGPERGLLFSLIFSDKHHRCLPWLLVREGEGEGRAGWSALNIAGSAANGPGKSRRRIGRAREKLMHGGWNPASLNKVRELSAAARIRLSSARRASSCSNRLQALITLSLHPILFPPPPRTEQPRVLVNTTRELSYELASASV